MSAWNAAGPDARQEFMRRIKELRAEERRLRAEGRE
jgi:hypothetical protein